LRNNLNQSRGFEKQEKKPDDNNPEEGLARDGGKLQLQKKTLVKLLRRKARKRKN
jgi:predicted component of type VI protein secretion system